jgi:hypothetical protein
VLATKLGLKDFKQHRKNHADADIIAAKAVKCTKRLSANAEETASNRSNRRELELFCNGTTDPNTFFQTHIALLC